MLSIDNMYNKQAKITAVTDRQALQQTYIKLETTFTGKLVFHHSNFRSNTSNLAGHPPPTPKNFLDTQVRILQAGCFPVTEPEHQSIKGNRSHQPWHTVLHLLIKAGWNVRGMQMCFTNIIQPHWHYSTLPRHNYLPSSRHTAARFIALHHLLNKLTSPSTGWSKRPVCFWELITFWRLMAERHVVEYNWSTSGPTRRLVLTFSHCWPWTLLFFHFDNYDGSMDLACF